MNFADMKTSDATGIIITYPKNRDKYEALKAFMSVLNIKFEEKAEKDSERLISIDEYNKELDDAEAEYTNGNYISHEEMRKQVKQW